MSSSIARRREAKAARRKKLLAERRRETQGGTSGSLAGRVERLARTPIYCCLLQEGLFETGTGTLILARGTPPTGFVMASFLLDPFCLGVKDVICRPIEASELEEVIAVMEEGGPFVDVEPAYARKLLRDLVLYARSIGLEPPREHKVAERLFGDVSADAVDATFEFGVEGRPLYIADSTETPAQVRERLERLRRTLGEDGFDFEEDGGEEGDGEEDEDLILADEEGLFEDYDPAVAPDPGEWLAMDEDERRLQVKYHHRRAGVHLENETAHAIFHVIVENQIAGNDPPIVGPTVNRLMAEGLDRHDAIHAVAAVLGGFMFETIRAEGAVPFATDEYVAALERLTPESWRRDYGEEESGERP